METSASCEARSAPSSYPTAEGRFLLATVTFPQPVKPRHIGRWNLSFVQDWDHSIVSVMLVEAVTDDEVSVPVMLSV
jgi:hypothetical protein